ncbi:uncharacterized protein G2W53_022104 [Senna tora]|uniref:Uncharacterized protein n=1 Tax=Senna tora TaxID=362788 RepID=A0A834TNW2_9FABA|nr:uncharacterized protein G2W53_022104 [Senna tora]
MSKRVVALVSQTDRFALDLRIRMGLVIAWKVWKVKSKHIVNSKSQLSIKRTQKVQA